MLCEYLLHPDKRDFGLKSLAKRYLGETMRSYEDLVGDAENIAFVDTDTVARYACHDADASWKLVDVLLPKLEQSQDGPSPRRAFDDIEVPLVSVLAAMERNGVKIDLGVIENLSEEFSAEIQKSQSRIYEIAGTEININSPKQLSELMFEKMNIPTKGIKKTKLGYSTSANVLERLAGDYEIADRLLEYRELHKLISTYLDALKRLVHPQTSRIHAHFNQAVAATGRLSSSDPNLQNIPIRNPRGRRIRTAFVADEGCSLLSADYSQIELRVLAHLSGDKQMIDAFRSGEDIHLRTAKELFGTVFSDEQELSDLRRVAKTLNFGIIFTV